MSFHELDDLFKNFSKPTPPAPAHHPLFVPNKAEIIYTAAEAELLELIQKYQIREKMKFLAAKIGFPDNPITEERESGKANGGTIILTVRSASFTGVERTPIYEIDFMGGGHSGIKGYGEEKGTLTESFDLHVYQSIYQDRKYGSIGPNGRFYRKVDWTLFGGNIYSLCNENRTDTDYLNNSSFGWDDPEDKIRRVIDRSLLTIFCWL